MLYIWTNCAHLVAILLRLEITLPLGAAQNVLHVAYNGVELASNALVDSFLNIAKGLVTLLQQGILNGGVPGKIFSYLFFPVFLNIWIFLYFYLKFYLKFFEVSLLYFFKSNFLIIFLWFFIFRNYFYFD